MDSSVAHVDKKSKNETIFKVFDRLLRPKNREKACAVLVDFLKNNSENVGSTNAVSYTIKRLVRGLAAQDPEKQNVFFSTICTTLSSGIITADDVLEGLNNVVENTGASKSELSSINVTVSLTYGAIIIAGKLFELSEEEQTNAVEKLVAICNLNHSYLKSASCEFLFQAAKTGSKLFAKNTLLPVIRKHLPSSGNNVGYELLPVIAAAYLKYTKIMQKLIDEKFGGRVQFLETVLMRGCHFAPQVQEDIIEMICLDVSLSGKAKVMLELWTKVVEREFKPGTALKSWQSYMLGFAKVLLDVMPDDDELHQCLPPKLIDTILKSLQIHDKKLASYVRAKDVLSKVTERVAESENKSLIAFKIITQIFSNDSGQFFDKKTKTTTVQSLIACLAAAETQKLADELVVIIKDKTKKGAVEKNIKDLPLLGTMLIKLATSPEMRKLPVETTKYLEFIFDLSFLKSTTTSDVKAKISDLFYKAIDLNSVKLDEAVVILSRLVNHVESNWSDLAVKIKDTSLAQWKNMLTTNKKLEVKATDKKYVAIRVLLLHMGLRIFRDEDLASSTIQELIQCYQRVKDRKGRKSLAETETEPHWVEVTVDLLLSMLSNENKVLRNVVSLVFPSITSYLTPTAIQQIVDALDPTSRNDVLKHIDSDESEDEEMEEADENNDFDSEDGEDESAGSDVDDDGEETVNDKLRMAVRNALGYSAALTDDESVDMDDMNEDEENRLNESLSNAFRLFRPSKGTKKKQGKDDEALMHFRTRVLDLVEIITLNTPTLSTCIELVDPLFALLEFSIKDAHQKSLQARLEAVIKKLGNVKKFSDETQSVAYSEVLLTFKRLFEKDISGMVFVEMSPSITEVSSLFLRASQIVPNENSGETMEKFFETLLDRHYVQNDRKVPLSIFQHSLRTFWDGNWQLSQHIFTLLLDPNLKKFKKIKLMELLEVFYRNDRLHSTATDDSKITVCTFEAKFVKKFAKLLREQNSKKENKLLAPFYCRIISLVQMALQSRVKYRDNCTPEPAWKLVVSYLLENINIFSQQKPRNKVIYLARQLDLPVPSKEELNKMKMKVTHEMSSTSEGSEASGDSDAEDMEDQGSSSKKNKSRGDEGRKMKKQSREKRLMVSSEGLENVGFSSMLDLVQEGEPAAKKSRKSVTEKSPTKKKVKK